MTRATLLTLFREALSVDRHPIGDGAVGPLTAKVRDAYFQVVRGGASHPEWRTPVYP